MVFTMKTLLQAGLNGRVSVLPEKRIPIRTLQMFVFIRVDLPARRDGPLFHSFLGSIK